MKQKELKKLLIETKNQGIQIYLENLSVNEDVD